jgi:long-subunit fatty acid transport protein
MTASSTDRLGRARRVVAATLLLGMAGTAVPARAAGSAETYGHDVRSMGKANAVLADDTATAAPFVNPAALARVRSPTLTASFQLAIPSVDIVLDRAPSDPSLTPALPSPVPGSTLAFATPVQLFVPDRLFLGVTAYFPSLVAVRARSYDPARPSFFVYDAATEHYEIFAAAALRIADFLAVGGGIRLGAGQGGSTRMGIDLVRGRFVRQEIDTSQRSIPVPVVGVFLGPVGLTGAAVRFAFVFRDASSFDVTLPATLDLTGLDVGLLLDIQNRANFSPRMWNGGMTLDVWEAVSVSFDAQYAQWSEAPPPFLRVRNIVTGAGVERLGFAGALDVPADGEDRVLPPGFVDTWNLRAGVEGRIAGDRLALRAGYGWRPTPVPDQTSGTNIVDNSSHTLACGATTTFVLPEVAAQPFQIAASYQAIILTPRSAEKASGRDPVGSWTASGVVHHAGLELRYAW